MTVSVIIPVFNVEQYILECLRSVANQTFRGCLECIIVDDCGTDASMDIAESFVHTYEGPISFRIIHHECNKGLSAARNTGMDATSCDYVYFLDSDDWIEPNCIDLLVKYATKYAGVDLVQGGVYNPTHYLLIRPYVREYYDDRKEISQLLLSDGLLIPSTSWNKLISNEFLRRNTIARFKEGFFYEDSLFSYILAQCVTSIVVVNYGTYHYRELRLGSITSRGEQDYWNARLLMEYLANVPSINRGLFLNYIFSKVLYFMSFPVDNVNVRNVEDAYRVLLEEGNFEDKIILWSLRVIPKRIRRIKAVYHFYLKMAFRCPMIQQ